jgi:hypothetical protein
MDGPHPFDINLCAHSFGETFFVTISFSELADIQITAYERATGGSDTCVDSNRC